MSIIEGITGEVEGSSLRWEYWITNLPSATKSDTTWGRLNIFVSERILDGLVQVACGGSGEKWLDSGYNLKVGQAACNDGWEVL